MEICGSSSKNSEGFIDRSKVRILLCENDAKSSEHVFNLLVNCAYQVTSVKSARQVIDALNAVGPDIDIILAEVDLPMAKGMKMLKYITRDKDLRRIPVIMMSAQDEVSLVVKCLRLGAADYLVKPLRTNELLNLWTHMWRRRRMLGLAEKNVVLYDFDVVGSDPSDANTTSTTLFSDDTDDKSRKKANPEISMSFHNEETNAVMPAAVIAVEPPFTQLFGYRSGVPGINDCRTGLCSPGPKKSEWKVGECSAFFTYDKSSIANNTSPHFAETSIPDPMIINRVQTWKEQKGQNIQTDETVDTWEKSSQGDDLPITISSSAPDSHSLDNRSSTPASNNSKEKESSQGYLCPRNELQVDVSNLYAHSHHPPYPYFMPGMVNQVMAPYPMNLHGMQHFSHLTQCPPPHVQFPYHQVNMYLPPGQIPNPHPWHLFGNGVRSSGEVKTSKVDRREAALLKFRQKRKERCFDKKIRYVNRKRLAERRPRVRGQFVRKMNGVNVDLNGRPNSGDFEEEDDEED